LPEIQAAAQPTFVVGVGVADVAVGVFVFVGVEVAVGVAPPHVPPADHQLSVAGVYEEQSRVLGTAYVAV